MFTKIEEVEGRDPDWFIEIDQYHIVAKPGSNGKPTPEGAHSDGTNYFMLVLVEKSGVIGGETTLLSNQGELLEKMTLDIPGDRMLLNDMAMLHDVSPIETASLDDGRRDILHISFTNLNRSGSIERRFGKNI